MTKVPRNHTTMHPHSAGLPPKQTEADLLDNLARRVYELESSLIKARRDIDQLRKGNADLVRELDELKRKEGGGMTVGKRIPQIGECVRYLGGDFDVKRHRNITEGRAYEVTGFDPDHNAAEIRDNENDVWMIGEWNAEHYEVISNDPTAAMLTPDERNHYELDGRKLPAHYYIEGAHIVKGAVGKRKEPSYSAEELYSASAAERYGHLKAVEAGDGRLYNVKLYTVNANYHVLRLDDEALARLESDLETDVAEDFAQYYCHDAEAVVGVRLGAVELYTVKVAEE